MAMNGGSSVPVAQSDRHSDTICAGSPQLWLKRMNPPKPHCWMIHCSSRLRDFASQPTMSIWPIFSLSVATADDYNMLRPDEHEWLVQWSIYHPFVLNSVEVWT